MTVNCVEKSILQVTWGGGAESELVFTDTVKVKYWEKLLSQVPAHWNSTHQNRSFLELWKLTTEFTDKHTISQMKDC